MLLAIEAIEAIQEDTVCASGGVKLDGNANCQKNARYLYRIL